MPTNNENYEYIKTKIGQLKEVYPSLRNKTDDYVFSILSIKSNFYKNPSYVFNETMMADTIVDGTNDGGVDALLTDPNSEESNLVIVQSKFYQSISFEDVVNAVTKMVRFYNDMLSGNYGNFNQEVTRRFLNLNAEVGDESKIVFVFYTSANKSGINNSRLQRAFRALLTGDKYELKIYFAEDICDEIKEAESRRPTVESGKLFIDEANNVLKYGDDAIIVSVSAFGIKDLYGKNGLNLLARNLRYHVAGKAVDQGIKQTIKDNPDDFWFMNNGLTVLCDEFRISGKEIHLKNFSIVNGGQTTYNLYKSSDVNRDNDFYLPCKVIKVRGNNEDQKILFSLEIAKATNSQKAIKQVDLKANSPEQIRFSNAMKANGIYYQTKRGEVIPANYRDDYKNSDLSEVGKLCLSAVFQLPASSRSKPSMLYNSEYYEPIFNENQDKIAKIAKELLYIDYYFRNIFLKKFDNKEQNNPNASELIPFAHNARTICIAFSAFASRYKSGNIDSTKLSIIFNNIRDGSYSTYFYDIFKNIDSITTLFPTSLFENKDKFDNVLYNLFDAIIKAGRKCYASDRRNDSALNETNYLKRDNNYYSILKIEWDTLNEKINQIFAEIE